MGDPDWDELRCFALWVYLINEATAISIKCIIIDKYTNRLGIQARRNATMIRPRLSEVELNKVRHIFSSSTEASNLHSVLEV